jgi:hypothetical protein
MDPIASLRFSPLPVHLRTTVPFPPPIANALRQVMGRSSSLQTPYWLPAVELGALGLKLADAQKPHRVPFQLKQLIYNVNQIHGVSRLPALPPGQHAMWAPGAGWQPIDKGSLLSRGFDDAMKRYGFTRTYWAKPRSLNPVMLTTSPAVEVALDCCEEFVHSSQLGSAFMKAVMSTKRLTQWHYWGRSGERIWLDDEAFQRFKGSGCKGRAWFLDEDLAQCGLQPRDDGDVPVFRAVLRHNLVCYRARVDTTPNASDFTPEELAMILAAAPPPPTYATSPTLRQQVQVFDASLKAEAPTVSVLTPQLSWISGAWAAVDDNAAVAPGLYVDASIVDMLCIRRFSQRRNDGVAMTRVAFKQSVTPWNIEQLTWAPARAHS